MGHDCFLLHSSWHDVTIWQFGVAERTRLKCQLVEVIPAIGEQTLPLPEFDETL